MANSAAHRGVLTRSSQSHLCDDGKLEAFLRRQVSRCRFKALHVHARYRRRMTEIANLTDNHQLLVRGLRQPTATGAYGMRMDEDE